MNHLRYDYGNLLSSSIGEAGIDAFLPSDAEVRSAIEELHRLASSDRVTFPQLPEQDLTPVLTLAEADRTRCSDLVVVGIGGSSLGSRALLAALPVKEKGPRVHVLENVDPADAMHLMAELTPETTLVNVISKSGGTVETMANFLVLRQWLLDHLGEEGYRERVRVTTDPASGALRQFAEDEGLITLAVPPAVGGRFSVLSAVGLYPLAVRGVDVSSILAGAGAARDAALQTDPSQNAAALFAAHQVAAMRAGRNGVVFMPYATRLFDTALWFVQLWAESLGKAHRRDGRHAPVGSTPVPALGANDQHSQLQLFMEGPDERTVILLDAPSSASLKVPKIPPALAALSHLEGKPLAEILRSELRGVRAALTAASRPNATLTIEEDGPAGLGALLMFLQCATGIAGSLLDVNPYDQPGVELAKRFAHTLLGRPGQSELLASVAAAESSSDAIGIGKVP